jgi:molybdopterin/thiamine biosynthesis adenylyltransferase
MIDFSEEQLVRYSRHIILPEVGVEGQVAIGRAKVLIIGTGGLGSPAALYLAAAGVGTIGIIDDDVVEPSNLQRQISHFTKDVGRLKVDSTAEKMLAINPEVRVIKQKTRVMAENIAALIEGYDFIVDGTDTFGTKFLINDACVMAGISFSHGGILRFDGQTFTVVPGESACYRCAFREPPPPEAVPTCSQAGILGAIAGMLGTIQAAEALKYITGVGTLLTDRLLSFNAKDMIFRQTPINRQENCPLCGREPSITKLEDCLSPACTMRPAGGL